MPYTSGSYFSSSDASRVSITYNRDWVYGTIHFMLIHSRRQKLYTNIYTAIFHMLFLLKNIHQKSQMGEISSFIIWLKLCKTET